VRQARFVTCEGKGHCAGLAQCAECAPFWGHYPVCPECGYKLIVAPTGTTGVCDVCGRRWNTRRPRVFRGPTAAAQEADRA
jgi:hypothetical protein